jgi:hypothetical protein
MIYSERLSIYSINNVMGMRGGVCSLLNGILRMLFDECVREWLEFCNADIEFTLR